MTLPDMIDHKAVKQMEPHEYNMRVWADKRAIEVIDRKKARIRELESALRKLIKGYVNTLESGAIAIQAYGGKCDPVDVMEAGDPHLREARAVLGVTSETESTLVPCGCAPGDCHGGGVDTTKAYCTALETKIDLSSPPSIATRNEMRAILGLEPLTETKVNLSLRCSHGNYPQTCAPCEPTANREENL